jgi:hypothetical protein
MVVSIEVPEQLFGALESRARELHSSVQAVAIKAIEDAIQKDIPSPRESTGGHRVRLPLIRSASPGSLRSLTNAEIDGILGN